MKKEWNEFVERSRNSTFLFARDYMDYHGDRFADFSLMAFRNGKLSALLPANISDATLYSHQGLTYGGWLWPEKGLDTTDIFLLWCTWLQYCEKEKIEEIVYKPLPYIYAKMPSEEDRYMLFLCRATLEAVDVSSAINFACNPGFNKMQRRHFKNRSPQSNYILITADNTPGIEVYHHILSECLESRHSAAPVHTVAELQLLMRRFRERIKIWMTLEGDNPTGGVCVYDTGVCAHCQYIATTEEGRAKNCLTPLVNELIYHYGRSGVRYLDFGISNEKGGRYLNPGLNRQKTSYGASGVAYTHYRINVTSALASMPTDLWPPH